MSRGDRVHDPAFHHFASQLRRRPVAHRDPAVLGLLAGHRDDRRELFGREPCRCSRSRQVRQDGANLDAQVSVGRGLLFGCRQRRLCVAPAITPLSDRASGALEPLRLLLVARTVGTRQHDRGSFCQPPRRASRHDQLRQDRALTRRHRDAPGSSRHGWTSSWVPSLHAGRRAKFSGNKFRRAGLVVTREFGPPLNNGLLLAVRSASLRSAQRPSAQAATARRAKHPHTLGAGVIGGACGSPRTTVR